MQNPVSSTTAISLDLFIDSKNEIISLLKEHANDAAQQANAAAERSDKHAIAAAQQYNTSENKWVDVHKTNTQIMADAFVRMGIFVAICL